MSLSNEDAEATLRSILRGETKPLVKIQESMPNQNQKMLVAAMRLAKSTEPDLVVETLLAHVRCRKLHGSVDDAVLESAARAYLDKLIA